MNIGEVARATGLPERTLRYYETIGLLRPQRSENGYRVFSDRDLAHISVLKRARALGFNLEDCRLLLSLFQDEHRASADVKALARRRLEELDGQIAELEAKRRSLQGLVDRCHGDQHPDCPILDGLAGDARARRSRDAAE